MKLKLFRVIFQERFFPLMLVVTRSEYPIVAMFFIMIENSGWLQQSEHIVNPSECCLICNILRQVQLLRSNTEFLFGNQFDTKEQEGCFRTNLQGNMSSIIIIKNFEIISSVVKKLQIKLKTIKQFELIYMSE